MKSKGYDITKKKLTYSQEEKKKSISNVFNCLNSIGVSEKGFSKENLNEIYLKMIIIKVKIFKNLKKK